MSRIDDLTAELCDELMVAASSGKLEHIKGVVLMLIDFSSVELSKHNKTEAASALLRIGKDLDASFSLSFDRV